MGRFMEVLTGRSGAMDRKIATVLATAIVVGVLGILIYALAFHRFSLFSIVFTPSRFDMAKKEQTAYTHFFGGDFKRAGPELEEIVEKRPKNIKARLMLGNVYARTGEVEKATRLFEGVLKMEPGQDEAYANLGAIYERQGTNAAAENRNDDAMLHFLEAEEQYKKAISNLREKKRGFLYRFSLLSRMEQVDESVTPATKRELYNEALERVRKEKGKLK